MLWYLDKSLIKSSIPTATKRSKSQPRRIMSIKTPDFNKRAKRTVPSRFVMKRQEHRVREVQQKGIFRDERIQAKLIKYDVPFCDWDNAWASEKSTTHRPAPDASCTKCSRLTEHDEQPAVEDLIETKPMFAQAPTVEKGQMF